MLAATAQTATQGVDPHDVIVAIVGGTMLTLALTRPRLRWVEQLAAESPWDRLLAERALTLLAFAMGGYAWTCLFVVLHRQLGATIDTMLRGAALFMIVYALLVHFEPFVTEWRLRGWLGAVILYIGVATFTVSIGVAIAETLLWSFTLTILELPAITGGLALACWLAYRALPRLEGLLRQLTANRKREARASDAR